MKFLDRNDIRADPFHPLTSSLRSTWTGYKDAPQAVRDLLGELDHRDTEFREGDISERDYREALLGLTAPAR